MGKRQKGSVALKKHPPRERRGEPGNAESGDHVATGLRGLARWNLAALTIDVTFFAIGMAFLDPGAVLPLLLARLGAAGPLIGAASAARFLAFSGVQIFVSYATHGREHQKPPLVYVATLTRLPLLLLPYLLWRAQESPVARATALWGTILLLSLWALGDGLGYVPWMEIVARTFSDRTRGRFFAVTQLISGLTGIGIAGLIVRNLLESPALPYPRNYALLAAVSALMFLISLAGILVIREPPIPQDAPAKTLRPPLILYLRSLPGLVRHNRAFARLAMVQILIGFGGAAEPFYVLYGTRRFALGDSWGGIYQMYHAFGLVVLMPVWTCLSERFTPAFAVRGVAAVCFLTPLCALTIGLASPGMYGIVFFLMGGSLGWATWIVVNHYLLTVIGAADRAAFVALLNLLFAPAALYPILGGLLAPTRQFVMIGAYPALFALTACVTGGGLWIAFGLPAGGTETVHRPTTAASRGEA